MKWAVPAIALPGLLGGALALGLTADQAGGFAAPQPVDGTLDAKIARGSALFTSTWHVAGGEEARSGLGPMYNAVSCNDCHNGGLHGIGPTGNGIAPTSLVIRLSATNREDSAGDPIYGRVFSAHSIPGVQTEGSVRIEYRDITGYYYPFGGEWRMREPHYQLTGLTRGPLQNTTIIRPRIAPSLYGLGLIEAIPVEALSVDSDQSGHIVFRIFQGKQQLGRFGWQSGAVSLRDQTTRALVDEIGVTSSEQPVDDCTSAEPDCGSTANSPPEADDSAVTDITAYLGSLGAPSHSSSDAESRGRDTFVSLGCGACHRPQWSTQLNGKEQVISPYTDLKLHNLGMEMSDETVAGIRVATEWRTAPLWGIGLRLKTEKAPTFLHDGRARTLEEAILWHYGEARHARYRFMTLGPNARKALLHWLQTL